MLKTAKPFSFDKLEFYSPQEVQLWNACCRILPSPHDWRDAIAEVFGEMLQRSGGYRLSLGQTHSIETASAPREYVFETTQVSLGRNPENDVVLAANSVSKQHARLTLKEGNCYLEDLGSRMGTFVNKKRVSENSPVLLQTGDQFSLFPYNFTFKLEKIWISDSQVDLFSGGWKICRLEDFLRASNAGEREFRIEVSPASQCACLRVGSGWVQELLRRLLEPLGAEVRRAWKAEPDYGFLEFVFLSVLERVQRRVTFPFHFSLKPGNEGRVVPSESRGMTSSFTLALPGVSGVFRVFVPLDLLASVERQFPTKADYVVPSSIRWRFLVTLGHVDLTPQELHGLETSDVVLFDANSELLFPWHGRRGWMGSLVGNAFRVNSYFERSYRMEPGRENAMGGDTANQRPDFGQLPVLLHVVVGEKELSLAEANGLIPGSIVELPTREGEPVDLVINGTRVGKGELVNVDGRLGVKIIRWSPN
jgi:flagellar motor switch/type III secretory pathway protein FliN/pSer/pThr/pTyr-binding forkhead associated (FHA) protein